jgi:tetratricopeptide (TPR) repeat protein
LSDLIPEVQRPAPPAAASQKDNILFLMGGLLVGFVVAYLMFEAMASRQPPRLTPALRAQIVDGNEAGGGAMGGGEAPAGAAPQAADPAAAGAGAGGGPAMAEIQQLRDFVEKNPNDAAAVRKLADLNFDIQNWQRAQELYAHYLELKPNDTDVMTDLGITYRGLRQFDKALALFDQAKKLDPNHWQSYYNEVVVLAFDLKKTAEAKAALAKLEQMQPANPDVKKLADAVARTP